MDKILNIYFFAALNLAIILVTELTGSFMHDKNLIHLFAIIFIVFAVYRVISNYQFFDAYVRNFLKISLVALLTLSFMPVIELLLMDKITVYVSEKTVDTFILVMYAASILLSTVAVEYLLSVWKRESKWMNKMLIGLMLLLGAIVVYLFAMHPSEEQLGIISISIIVSLAPITAFALYRIGHLKKSISILREFCGYLQGTVVFIGLAGVFEYFEINNMTGFQEFQNTYLTFFLIFIAISCFILAFGKPLRPVGIYKEIVEKK